MRLNVLGGREINDLLSVFGQPRVVAIAPGRPDAQGLEQHAKEPGQQNVARDEPGQLFPVLFTVTNGHFVGFFQTKLLALSHWNLESLSRALSSWMCLQLKLTSTLHLRAFSSLYIETAQWNILGRVLL